DNPVPFGLHRPAPQPGVIRLPTQATAELWQATQGRLGRDFWNPRDAWDLRNSRMSKVLANAHDDDAMARLRNTVILAADEECCRIPLDEGGCALRIFVHMDRKKDITSLPARRLGRSGQCDTRIGEVTHDGREHLIVANLRRQD